MRNAIFYIESLEMLLAESEKDEAIEEAEQEGIETKEKENNDLSESKKVDESVTSLTSATQKKYQSKTLLKIFCNDTL